MTLSLVTGAWSYLGRSIASELLARGFRVRTLTSRHRPEADPFNGAVDGWPLQFAAGSEPAPGLLDALAGVDTLYNTYWVRHNRPPRGQRGTWIAHPEAVRRSCQLIDAAKMAGVRRVVQFTHTRTDLASDLPYFAGKAAVERHLRDSGLSHAILRPNSLFGHRDIIINNVAWAVRRFAVFPLPGPLGYRVRPIHVDDLAAAACDLGADNRNVTRDACGPEQYAFDDLVRWLGRTLTGRAPIVLPLPPRLCQPLFQATGWVLGDTILSWSEIKGLVLDLLSSDEEPLGSRILSDWVHEHREDLGREFRLYPYRLQQR